MNSTPKPAPTPVPMTGIGWLPMAFERTVTGVILANAGLVVAGLVLDGHEGLFEVAHDAILTVFVLELLLRLRAGGWRFLRRPLNAFDAMVIAVSCLPVLGVDASVLRLARLARLLHLARHLTHLTPHVRLLRFLRVGAVPVAQPGNAA